MTALPDPPAVVTTEDHPIHLFQTALTTSPTHRSGLSSPDRSSSARDCGIHTHRFPGRRRAKTGIAPRVAGERIVRGNRVWIGAVDVDAQDLAEQEIAVLRAIAGISAATAIAEADIQVPVRSKQDVTAAVNGERLIEPQKDALGRRIQQTVRAATELRNVWLGWGLGLLPQLYRRGTLCRSRRSWGGMPCQATQHRLRPHPLCPADRPTASWLLDSRPRSAESCRAAQIHTSDRSAHPAPESFQSGW